VKPGIARFSAFTLIRAEALRRMISAAAESKSTTPMSVKGTSGNVQMGRAATKLR